MAILLRDVRAELRAAGFQDDVVEAETILCRALGVEPTWLYANPEAKPSSEVLAVIRNRVERRVQHEPLAYITGVAHFFGREFEVDRRVLIPRPETEMLVERAVAHAAGRRDGGIRIADIGTGSGVLAITLALELSKRTEGDGVDPGEPEVHAVDASAEALDVARANTARHGVQSLVRFHLGDLSAPLTGRFQVVVANLPYLRTADILDRQPEVQFEPRSALDGGPDGMALVGPLIDDLPRLMGQGPSIALLEIDPPIAAAAANRARAAMANAARTARARADVSVLKDLAGLERVLEIILRGGDAAVC